MRAILPPSLGTLLLFLLWEVVAKLGLFNPIFFASPSEVFTEFIKMLNEGAIIVDLGVTAKRVAISLALSSLIGIPIGLMLGYFTKLNRYFAPIMDLFRSIPPVVIYPLLLISLGPSDVSRIGTAVFGSTTLLVLLISQGLSQADRTRLKFFQSRGASLPLLFREVILFEALPDVLTAERAAASLSLIVIVVTEMLVGGQYGLGARVQQVQITSNVPDLFATILLIGLFGVLLNAFFALIEKRLVFWRS